jgi:putative FmdB family regulatory protein
MPFYEYECQACKFYTEVMQKISDAPLTKCPSCGKRKLKKLVSAPVFRLKGGGWYETDFKSDQEAKRNLVATEKEETKSETKSDTKTDSKGDAKSEARTDAKEAKSDAKETKSEGKTAASAASSRRSVSSSAKSVLRPVRSKATRKRRR